MRSQRAAQSVGVTIERVVHESGVLERVLARFSDGAVVEWANPWRDRMVELGVAVAAGKRTADHGEVFAHLGVDAVLFAVIPLEVSVPEEHVLAFEQEPVVEEDIGLHDLFKIRSSWLVEMWINS